MAAIATPTDNRGHLDQDALADYIRSLDHAGLAGVCVWAHTGRGLQSDESSRATTLRIARENTRGLVISGVGAPPDRAQDYPTQLRATITMAESAIDGGAEAVMVYPCSSMRAGRRYIRDLHREVAALGVPVIAFLLYPAASAHTYSLSEIDEILAIPGVIGVKVATLDRAMQCQDVIAAIHRHGALAITGEDRMFGASLMWGAEAALVGIAAACPELSVATMRAWVSGDFAAFVSASAELDRFARLSFIEPMNGYVQRMLWAAAATGLIPWSAAHDACGPPLDDSERRAVLDYVTSLRAAM